MVFFDTCIWIELFSVRTPIKPHEIKQAYLASSLLEKTLNEKEHIVTCKEQLIEVVSAVQKIKLKESVKISKDNGERACGSIKEYRKNPQFLSTKLLCKNVIDDIKYFAKIENCNVNIDEILNNIHLMDINDYMYYEFCQKNNIKLFTFDSDLFMEEDIDLVTVLN